MNEHLQPVENSYPDRILQGLISVFEVMMKTMLGRFFLVGLILISGGILFADMPARGWTLEPSVSLHWGMAREIVYSAEDVDRPLYSLLLWELNPVLMAGMDVQWASGKRFKVKMGFHTAVPGLRTGKMEDYDWIRPPFDNWSHWSESKIWLRWGFIVNGAVDWQVVDANRFGVNIGLAYRMEMWAWRDALVDHLYSESGFRDTPVDPSLIDKNSINYRVGYHSLLAEVSLFYSGRVFQAGLQGSIGPTLIHSLDEHLLRTEEGNINGLQFYDHGFGGPWLGASLRLGFRTAGRFSFFLRGDWAWLRESRGYSETVYSNGDPRSYEGASVGFAFWRASISALGSWSLATKP